MPATTVEVGDVVVVNCSHRCNVSVTDDSPRLPLGEPLFLLRAPLESGLAHARKDYAGWRSLFSISAHRAEIS